MRRSIIVPGLAVVVACVCLLVAPVAASSKLPLGELVHDGPATPEQISLFLPVTGNLPYTATATVRYRRAGAQIWTEGHPLLRIRPEFSLSPGVGAVPDAFAWPIIDLDPGTPYDLEVTVASGSAADTKTATFTTRALPAPTSRATVTILAGASIGDIQARLDRLAPGDVLEFENGTYAVDGLHLTRSGTPSRPITVRGTSRAGVTLHDPDGAILYIQDASHLVIENLTLRGSGVDPGNKERSRGVIFDDGAPRQTGVTIRNVTIDGVDRGIVARKEIVGFLAYDNRLVGNNSWTPDFTDTNSTWNDDGIRIPGFGNAAFNNTLIGFGDALSYATHAKADDTLTQTVGVHFYRNDVRNSGDDFAEIDDGHRNLTLYDNRSHNSMTFISLDPLYGGPFVAARNTAINVGRSPYKFTSPNTGYFIYNNTVVRTTGYHWLRQKFKTESAWIQHRNGRQRAYGYRNNILVYLGVGTHTLYLSNRGHDPIDFTHNSWYPDRTFTWRNEKFMNLWDVRNYISPTSPVFSGMTHRHAMDNITEPNPWSTSVSLGADYRTEVTETYTLALAPDTKPKHSGVVIPNITDGFSGAAPDRGAIISGRQIPHYGDRSDHATAPQ